MSGAANPKDVAQHPAENSSSEADLFASICRGIPEANEIVYLVARDGKRFLVREEVLTASTDYFKAALQNGMRESGWIISKSSRMIHHSLIAVRNNAIVHVLVVHSTFRADRGFSASLARTIYRQRKKKH
jgi:hypothetical protein